MQCDLMWMSNSLFSVVFVPDVVRRGPAAPAGDVDEAVPRELHHVAARRLRGLVVAAEGVRQPRVGVADHERVCGLADCLDKGPHFLRSECAV